MEGVFEKAVSAIKAAQAKGFTVNVNATIFDGHSAEDIAKFLDFAQRDGRRRFDLARLRLRARARPGALPQPPQDQGAVPQGVRARQGQELEVHALRRCSSTSWPATANIHCTPWGMPTRNIFGWQKPCYLLGEGYAKTFKELMETTDWDSYGTGRYEKCANCMAHCGYEPTAAHASITQSVQGAVDRDPRRAHRRADGAGNRARPAAARRSSCSPGTSRR